MRASARSTSLRGRVQSIRADLYATLTPWQRVMVARHPNRPGIEDFIKRLFPNFVEIHGDRRFADDHAHHDRASPTTTTQPVLVVGHVKGGDTKDKIFRNFGYARPEGYRKALGRCGLPKNSAARSSCSSTRRRRIPGIDSEERGVAEAIAVNLRDMMRLDTPIVVIVSGEGGSGGALGIAVGDRVLMQEFAIYSVIPPEGCAAILWRDAKKKVEAAEALRLTAPDLLRFRDHRRNHPGTCWRRAHRSVCSGAARRRCAEAGARDRSVPSVLANASICAMTSSAASGRLGVGICRNRVRRPDGVHSTAMGVAGVRRGGRGRPGHGHRSGAGCGTAPLPARAVAILKLASRFLKPSLDHLHDPMALADMRVAVDRLMAAIARRERIAIHGDYDVDGVTSTVILRRALELLGADVVHFIPERLKDGYGLQPSAIERLHAEGVKLVVSVDCGIRGIEAARRARDLGVDLIITDHHEPDLELPPALAVINPKRRDCSYPDKYLAGVGVALKLVQALCRRADRESWLPGFVKIAAIGTLADVVPLVGENRVIAKIGLDLLSSGPHKVGLRSLLDVSGLTGKAIDSYHISFMLAPRVNAAGRMSTPDIATRLLLATDERSATKSGRSLCNSTARTCDARKKRPGFSPPRRRSFRPIRISAHDRSSSSPARAGIAASSGSLRRSWSTPFIARPSSSRSRATSPMDRAAAFRSSTCWARSSGVRRCSFASAATGKRPV